MSGGASFEWIGLEVAGLGLFGALALGGGQGSAQRLAIGWALHPVWDFGIHLTGVGGEIVPAAFVPSWYAWLCLSFDLVIATASWRLGVESSPAAAR